MLGGLTVDNKRKTMTHFLQMVVLLFSFLALQSCDAQEKALKNEKTMTLIYVYDPLCGWCYGFSPVIQKFYDETAELNEVKVISGGMVTGERTGPIGEVAPYIKNAYLDVESSTGITFGESFLKDVLEEGSTIFTSIPPSIALAVFKDMMPEKQLQFAGEIQKAIYYDGVAPEDLQSWSERAAQYGLDQEDFYERLQSEKYAQKAREDFSYAQTLGVRGFPTVFVKDRDQYHLLSRGYMDYDSLVKSYEKVFDKDN